MSWTQTIERYLAEGRTVSGGKGDDVLKQQEQAQANFTNTLMQSYQKQFAASDANLQFLTSKLQPLINNPQGYSPEALAAMRTQATEGTATSFAQSQKALNEELAARGGSQLPSGVTAQLNAENANAAARANSEAQLGITQANEDQRLSNYWRAIGALSGVNEQYNPVNYAGAANSGTNATTNIGEAYKSSQSSQLLGALGGVAGGVGSALGGYFGRR